MENDTFNQIDLFYVKNAYNKKN